MAGISIDQTACVRCGACVEVCLFAKVYELTNNGAQAVRPERCWACGQCVAVCPTDAIDHDAFPLEDCPIPEGFSSLEQLITAFRVRRSCRTFENKPVPRENVRELTSLGRWAPTASNTQSIDWIALDDRARIADLGKSTVDQLARFARWASHPILRLLLLSVAGIENFRKAKDYAPSALELVARWAQGGDPVFYQAPVVLIGHGPKGNKFGRDDAIYATYNLMLAAERRGLATCQIGLFQAVIERSAKMQRAVGIPEGRVPQVAVALGFPQHTFRRLLPRRQPNLTWNPR